MIRIPHLLVAVLLSMMMTATPARATDTAPDIAPGPVDLMRADLDTLAKTDGLSGVVLIAKNGTPIFDQAYGFANLADHIPNRIDTKFNMASMGKMITAVAIMQLVESGKVSLNDKVGKHLPGFPNQAVREQVTIEQLLTHRSGMGNFWEVLADKAKERFVTVSDYIPLIADQPLASAPGARFAYSNNGYIILGLIIEAASGQSYFDYVRQHIYMPAGMTDTDAYELDQPVPNLAIGYTRDAVRPGRISSNIFVNAFKGGPAGGSFTTARDLLRFSTALLDHKLLNKMTTELMTSGKVDYGDRRYGYGFIEEIANGHRVIGHGGGHIGIADELMIFPDLGYVAVILTNGDVDNFWDVRALVKRDLVGASADTESLAYTKALVETARSSGYEAAAKRLASDPAHPALRSGVLEQAGYKLLWQSQVDAAIGVFRLYITASPDDAYAFLGLGTANARAGNKAEAIRAWRRYLALEPDDAEIKTKLAALIR
ncbi:MAG: serine hydrolase [Pseudomonadota bacterium]